MTTELDKIKKRVLSLAPDAKLRTDDCNNLYVEYRGISLSEEYLLPPTRDELQAWIYAELSLKTTQHFNRTHPTRLEGYSILETRERARGRSRKRRKTERTPYYSNEEDRRGWF